jgi:predicted DNA-binding transcriptional regulator AlpA
MIHPLKLLSLAKTAKMVGTSKETILVMVENGDFPRPIRFGKVKRYLESDVVAFIENIKSLKI